MKIIKKVTLITLIVLLCIPLFSIYASAGKVSTVTFSEDFSTMVLDGETYSKVNALYLYGTYYIPKMVEFIPTESQKNVLELEVFLSDDSYVVETFITFENGDQLTSYYVPKTQLQKFQAQINSYPDKLYIVNYPYYGDDEVFSYSLLKDDIISGETVAIDGDDVYTYHEVCGYEDGLYFLKGYLFAYGNNYYYLDLKQLNIVDPYDFDFYAENFNAIKITNPELLEILSDELVDVETSFIIIPAIFCILFSVVTSILGIVFTIIAKKIYRKLWATVAALSLLELALLIILIVLI